MPQVYRVVLTGGPCAGKTTATSVLSDRLQSLGFQVIRVPEAATILILGGIKFYGLTPEQTFRFQVNLLKVMMQLEDSFMDLAVSSGKPTVLLLDRGCMDCSAYVDASTWSTILDENGWTTVGLRDARYDIVIHLVSAACGKEDFYSLENNPARHESADEARNLDKKVSEAWVGHPYLRVVDNTHNFDDKVAEVVRLVTAGLGVGIPTVRKRKFLVSKAPSTEEFPERYQEFEVEHEFLPALEDGSRIRLRKRGQNGAFTYTHTLRKPDAEQTWVETRRAMTGREYASLRMTRDPAKTTVRKKRISFLYKKQYFELDYFITPKRGLMLLEAYMNTTDKADDLPPYLNIECEVTGNPEYSLDQLSNTA